MVKVETLSDFRRFLETPGATVQIIQHALKVQPRFLEPRKVLSVGKTYVDFVNGKPKGSRLIFGKSAHIRFKDDTATFCLDEDGSFKNIMVYRLWIEGETATGATTTTAKTEGKDGHSAAKAENTPVRLSSDKEKLLGNAMRGVYAYIGADLAELSGKRGIPRLELIECILDAGRLYEYVKSHKEFSADAEIVALVSEGKSYDYLEEIAKKTFTAAYYE